MAQRIVSQSIAAGATFDALDDWNYQYVPKNGGLKINHKASAVGLLCTIAATDRQLSQESAVPAGGTAGTTPTDFNAPPLIAKVFKGERLSAKYRNPTGGAITIDGVYEYR
jgi:hypothetical protein